MLTIGDHISYTTRPWETDANNRRITSVILPGHGRQMLTIGDHISYTTRPWETNAHNRGITSVILPGHGRLMLTIGGSHQLYYQAMRD
jgi:hypothetical protein